MGVEGAGFLETAVRTSLDLPWWAEQWLPKNGPVLGSEPGSVLPSVAEALCRRDVVEDLETGEHPGSPRCHCRQRPSDLAQGGRRAGVREEVTREAEAGEVWPPTATMRGRSQGRSWARQAMLACGASLRTAGLQTLLLQN